MGRKLCRGCRCGVIHYATEADPVMMLLNCNSCDFQPAGGSGYAPVLAMPRAALNVTGEPR